MAVTPSAVPSWHPQQNAIVLLQPDLRVQIRGPLEPGLSGASVFLADFQSDGERRMGVLKLTSPEKAEQELKGDATARASWMQPYLPDLLIRLGTLPATGTVAILSSVAKDRLENSQMLKLALRNAFRYAKDHALFAIAHAYRDQAARGWAGSVLHPVRRCFQEPIRSGLAAGWEQRWEQSGFPGPEHPSIQFEDITERWPNPVAFHFRRDLWPADEDYTISVPWIQSHGDLNPGNVLCPTATRAIALRIDSRTPDPVRLMRHLSFIDTPYCREAPFTFDPAFLACSLRFLLPPFDTFARRDVVLKAYRAALHEIATDGPTLEVSGEADKFAECLSLIWRQMTYSQPRMADDIRHAYLTSLSSAALWQAVKAANGGNREDAVSALCFGALCLHQLLAKYQDRLPKPDFELWTNANAPSLPRWTAASRQIGAVIQEIGERRTLVLFLGSDWARYLGLPGDDALADVGRQPLDKVQAVLRVAPQDDVVRSVAAIARLPLAAIVDWSLLRYPRRAVESGLSGKALLQPYFAGEREPTWSDRDGIPYLHLRGSVENQLTVAQSGPERSYARRALRGGLAHLRANRPPALTVMSVGCGEAEFLEVNEYLHDVWGDGLRSIYVGPRTERLVQYLTEWKIEHINGGIADFVASCADLPAASSITAEAEPRTVAVADMQLDEEGAPTHAEGKTLIVRIPEGDASAIARAGQLLYQHDRAIFSVRVRDPQEFFVGYRIEFSEIQEGVPIQRAKFPEYLTLASAKLLEKGPHRLFLPSQPGAGASTALRWLAYQLAFTRNIPTLVLSRGGSVAYDAIERVYRCVGRSFVVVADPQDVPGDELKALHARCAPPRYPVLFLSTVRATRRTAHDPKLLLEIELADTELADFWHRMHTYCATVDLGRLRLSPARSLFLLTLEAFGGRHVRVNAFVTDLMQNATEQQRLLVATVAVFSRFIHRGCSDDFLQTLTGRPLDRINDDLESFDQLLLLREQAGWTCRHDQLSLRILQYHLTGGFDPQEYRNHLAEFVCGLLTGLSEDRPGGDIAADYVWSLLNPQLEPTHVGSGGRFISGEDGVPFNAMRDRVFAAATTAFPTHVNIVSHYGKFLSEEEKNFAAADRYLLRASELEPDNKAVVHMIGNRYCDEWKDRQVANPPSGRSVEVEEEMQALAASAHEWFDKARDLDEGSEYNYTTPIQLDISIIRDEFRRLGAEDAQARVAALVNERVAAALAHAEGLVSMGLRYINPRDESRELFNQLRHTLLDVRGDLKAALGFYREYVRMRRGKFHGAAKVQFARLLIESADEQWLRGESERATGYFAEAEVQLREVLQDPAWRYKNIMLWYECARHLDYLSRNELIEKLLQMHEHDPHLLDTSFLLMCLYFADAVETRSTDAWRRHKEFEAISARRSANLAVRTYTREWLVRMASGKTTEYRVSPHHLFDALSTNDARPCEDNRVRLDGYISRIISATAGYVKQDVTGFEVFCQPRVSEHEFYKEDEERKTPVSFLVQFTYEKPIAFDVTRKGIGKQAAR